jgi:hypothetical protein
MGSRQRCCQANNPRVRAGNPAAKPRRDRARARRPRWQRRPSPERVSRRRRTIPRNGSATIVRTRSPTLSLTSVHDETDDGVYRITFTYGGIKIDKQGHALTPDNTRIPGLLVAGVDAGGFSNLGYAGGLALAFVTGFWAAREVARELELPLPQLPSADPRDAEAVLARGRL